MSLPVLPRQQPAAFVYKFNQLGHLSFCICSPFRIAIIEMQRRRLPRSSSESAASGAHSVGTSGSASTASYADQRILTPHVSPVASARSGAGAGPATSADNFGRYAAVRNVDSEPSVRRAFVKKLQSAMRRVYPTVTDDEQQVKSHIAEAFKLLIEDTSEDTGMNPSCRFAIEVDLATNVGGFPGSVDFEKTTMNRYLKHMYVQRRLALGVTEVDRKGELPPGRSKVASDFQQRHVDFGNRTLGYYVKDANRCRLDQDPRHRPGALPRKRNDEEQPIWRGRTRPFRLARISFGDSSHSSWSTRIKACSKLSGRRSPTSSSHMRSAAHDSHSAGLAATTVASSSLATSRYLSRPVITRHGTRRVSSRTSRVSVQVCWPGT